MHHQMTRSEILNQLQILDTPREDQFDEAVELAKIICRTSGALISFIDNERQWFKASFGFDVSETPVELSVCVHCLETDDVVIFEDLSKDPRTQTNPFVTGPPHLRFYAGVAIRGAQDIRVGALCVLDEAPRPGGLNREQSDFLRSKANEISGILMTRRAQARRS
jgi:GAF domain-containing protein